MIAWIYYELLENSYLKYKNTHSHTNTNFHVKKETLIYILCGYVFVCVMHAYVIIYIGSINCREKITNVFLSCKLLWVKRSYRRGHCKISLKVHWLIYTPIYMLPFSLFLLCYAFLMVLFSGDNILPVYYKQ